MRRVRGSKRCAKNEEEKLKDPLWLIIQGESKLVCVKNFCAKKQHEEWTKKNPKKKIEKLKFRNCLIEQCYRIQSNELFTLNCKLNEKYHC